MVRARDAVFAAVIIAGVSVPSVLSGQVPYVWVLPTIDAEYPSTDPFASLLAQRDVLALTSSQITRIERVRDRLIEDNRPLLAQIRDAEVYGVETEEERSALEAIRAAFDERAGEAELDVRQILMAEQIERADSVLGDESWTYPVRGDVETPRARAAARAREDAFVTVENHNYYDANVYVISGGRRMRLGFVGGLGTQTLEIPDEIILGAGGVRFEVVQIPRFYLPSTPEVSVFPGDRVVLRIPPS